MKSVVKVLVSMAILGLLSGCDQEKPADPDPQMEQLEQTIEQQLIAEDLQAIHQVFNQSQSTSFEGEMTVEIDDYILTKHSKGQENYQDEALAEGLITNIIQVNDQKWQEAFYHQDSKDYYQPTKKAWQESTNERLPDFFMVYMNYFFNGEDLFHRQDNRFEKSITNTGQLDQIATYLDWPIAFSPDAEYDLRMGLDFNPENNEVTRVDVIAEVTDQNRTYKINQVLDVQLSPDPSEIEVDLKEGPKHLQYDPNEFLDAFFAANPISAIYTYTLNGREIAEGHNEEWILYQNVLDDLPIYTSIGNLKENKLEDYHRLDPQEDSKSKTSGKQNLYRHFIQEFQTDFEDLDLIEEPDDQEQGMIETYRWLGEDLESFQEKVGDLDIAFLAKEGEVAYGIEYMVNRQTLTLETIILWSAEVSEQSVEDVFVLNFHNFNQFNPNNLVAMNQSKDTKEKVEEETTKE